MAIIPIRRTANLDGPVIQEYMAGTLFGGEKQAHKFIIKAVQGRADLPLTGTVSGLFIREADGKTVPLVGGIEDGAATVTLSANCYYQPGRFRLTIFVADGGSNTCVYAANGNVALTETETVIDPSGEISLSVAELMQDIQDAVASVPADYSSLLATIAQHYSDLTFPVKAGKCCWYGGTLYRAKQRIDTAESWTAGHWDTVVIMDDIVDRYASVNNQISALHTQGLEAESYEQGGVTKAGADSSFNQSTRVRLKKPLVFPGDVLLVSNYYLAVVDMDNPGAYMTGEYSSVQALIPAGTRFRFSMSSAQGGTATGGEITPAVAAPVTRFIAKGKAETVVKLGREYFEKGNLSENTGAYGTYFMKSRIRTKNLLNNAYDITVSRAGGAPSTAQVMVVYYDAADNFVSCADFENGTTIPKGSYFRVVLSLTPYTNTEAALEDIYAGFAFQYVADGEALEELGTEVEELRQEIIGFVTDDGASISGEEYWEKGNINENTGANSTWHASSRARMKAIARLNVDLSVSGVTNDAGCFAVEYDAQGGYVRRWPVKSTLKIPAGTYFRLCISENANTDVEKPLEDILGSFVFSYGTNTVETRNRDKDRLLVAMRKGFNNSRTGTYSDNFNRYNLFTIAHISDVHMDTARYQSFIDYVNGRNANLISAAIETGDLIDSPREADYAAMNALESERTIYRVVGNHEMYGAGPNSSTVAQCYTNMQFDQFGGTYYYVDFELQGVRLVVVNQFEMDNSSSYLNFTQAQIDWLISTLKSAQTAGLAVMIAMHMAGPDKPINNDSGFNQNFIMSAGSGVSCSGTPVRDIVNAFRHGGTINEIYTFSSGIPDVTVNTTFDGGGHFIAYLTGHVHADRCGFSEKYPDQLYLTVTNGGITSNLDYKTMDQYGDLTRVSGDVSEDAFNIYSVDLERRLVKALRIGADVNDTMKPRLSAVFEYEGPASMAMSVAAEQISGDDYNIIINKGV